MFTNQIEAMTEMNNILSKIPLEEFILIVNEWKCRQCKYIDRRGEYL
jgi:hypothetical protein